MSEARYEAVIGLEVHCQLKTSSKMFTACGFQFGAEPNTLTDAYTLGLPGTLPVPNRDAVRFAIALALAVNSEIHQRSRLPASTTSTRIFPRAIRSRSPIIRTP